MPRFAASLMFLFAEAPFEDRFALARRAGFRAVECQNPYGWVAEDIRRRLTGAGLEMVLINTPAGNWDRGERGFAALPGREQEFRESLERGLAYARTLSCPRLHVLAGNAPVNAETEGAYVANLRRAAARAEREGVRVLIEPLNPTDAPGYFLSGMAQARAIHDAVAHPNLWLQFDVYHAAMSGAAANPAAHELVRPYRGAPLAETFRAHMSRIAHIQIAGVPGRHEPIPSQVPYPELFALFDNSGYEGWVGCEYRPRGPTAEGLSWATRYGLGPLGD
jgi:hydroxypyruvate isomerase